MLKENFYKEKRSLRTVVMDADLVVVGGGMAGVCTAIAAARTGIRVTLVQDRPVLGGNASSEVRLWILGATSHMGNNNRWSREGGIIDEILVENAYRNKEGNPVILDTVILDKVKSEPNITLLLNTMVYDLEKSSEDTISKVRGFNSQTQLFYEISAPLFCDASGDGVIAYRAGAAFRVGAEDSEEFGERFAPDPARYGEILGHSIYFYSKDAGKPVRFYPPDFALKDIEEVIPRYRNISAGECGCKFWWLEHGGRMDTIADTEEIKWELWSVVYGIWNYIKNSGNFPEAENLTLEWVGQIPGKRESRRFVGHYTLKQDDIIRQTRFPDAVAHGGWAIDLHPADGVYSSEPGCTQYHSKGVYEIPYRCYVSRDVRNLFYAGRIISATHVAHGTSRVMATSALGGQAVGIAAAQCIRGNVLPADLMEPARMKELQQALNLMGQSIPHTRLEVAGNLAAKAVCRASSSLELKEIPADGGWYDLTFSVAQLLPLEGGTAYQFTVEAEAAEDTVLEAELRCSEKPFNYTPDTILEKVGVPLKAGVQEVCVPLTASLPTDQYGFVTFLKNDVVRLRMSEQRMTGIVSVFNKFNYDVNNKGKQTPPADSGIDSFEFWCPDRRPAGQNLAMKIEPPVCDFGVANVLNGWVRPYRQSNAWIADPADVCPAMELSWEQPQTFDHILLYFDTDYDHALESVQFGHPENVMPFCVRNYTILDDKGAVIYEKKGNYQTISSICLDKPITTKGLTIRLEHPSQHSPASLFQIVVGMSSKV